MIDDETLDMLQALSDACDGPPWTAVVEGRDGLSFASFIQAGEGEGRGDDIYVRRDSGPASAACLDLIAAARTWLPELIAEVRLARTSSRSAAVVDGSVGSPGRGVCPGRPFAAPDAKSRWPAPRSV